MIKKIIAGIVSCAAAFVFGSTLAHALISLPDEEIVATNPDGSEIVVLHTALPGDYPVRLVIPSINVDTNIQHVGITKKKTMAVPSNFTDVGWYKYGSVPGTMGSAVMAGHVDNALGMPAVFSRLDEIAVGADVYVLTKNGTQLHFVVDSVEAYSVDEAPAGKIFDANSVPRLNLITCRGDWIQSERQYSERLVVYTRLVGG